MLESTVKKMVYHAVCLDCDKVLDSAPNGSWIECVVAGHIADTDHENVFVGYKVILLEAL